MCFEKSRGTPAPQGILEFMQSRWLVLMVGCLPFGCTSQPTVAPSPVPGISLQSASPIASPPPPPAPSLAPLSGAVGSAPVAPAAASQASPPQPSDGATGAESTTAGAPHSRQDYLYRTARMRAKIRRPQVKRPPPAATLAADKSPSDQAPITLGGPKRLLYSGPADQAPAELLKRSDVLCEISPGGNVRFFGP